MGWLFPYGATRKSLIERRTRAEESEEAKRVCLRHTTRGNVLWTVWEVTLKTRNETKRYIGCDLLMRQSDSGDWGYKDLDEGSHPLYWTCPLSYLEMVPVICPEWREGVRAYHEARKPLRNGQYVRLGGCLLDGHPPGENDWYKVVNARRLQLRQVYPVAPWGQHLGHLWKARRRFVREIRDQLPEAPPMQGQEVQSNG